MLFSSISFLFLFLPISIVGYYLISLSKSVIAKNLWLLIVSLIFYFCGEGILTCVMAGIIIVNYFAGLFLEKTKNKKFILAAAVILNLSTLFIFKYLNFTISVVGGNAIENIILPIGISFYIQTTNITNLSV